MYMISRILEKNDDDEDEDGDDEEANIRLGNSVFVRIAVQHSSLLFSTEVELRIA